MSDNSFHHWAWYEAMCERVKKLPRSAIKRVLQEALTGIVEYGVTGASESLAAVEEVLAAAETTPPPPAPVARG